MRCRFRMIVAGALTSTLGGLFAANPASAQSDMFFEVSQHVLDIDAEFDDSIVLRSPSLLWNVPALQEADAMGFAVGGSPDGTDGTITFRYLRADPQATSILGDTVAAYRSYDFDFYSAPLLKPGRLSVSPVFRFGAGYTTLSIPGSATDGTDVGDGSFGSVGFTLGLGGIIRIANWVQVTADYSRRFLNFGSAKAFDRSLEIEDGLSATSDVFAIGVGVYIPDLRRSTPEARKPSKSGRSTKRK